RNDEIGELFNSFNKMAAALQQSKSGEPDGNNNVGEVGTPDDDEKTVSTKHQSNKKKVVNDVVADSPLLASSEVDIDTSIDATVMASSQINLNTAKTSFEQDDADKSVPDVQAEVEVKSSEIPEKASQANEDNTIEGPASSAKAKKAAVSGPKTAVKGKKEANAKDDHKAALETDAQQKPDEVVADGPAALTDSKPVEDVDDEDDDDETIISPIAKNNKVS
ncbi:MAG: hypothetical protein ACJA13_002974, partial [Paraglaciecola sp.]